MQNALLLQSKNLKKTIQKLNLTQLRIMKKNKAYYILAFYIIGVILLMNAGYINQNYIVPFFKYLWEL